MNLQNIAEFYIAGGTSNIIVQASEVNVSRTRIIFSTANLSAQTYVHGAEHLLLVYDNGWKSAPSIVDMFAFSLANFSIEGGETVVDRFNFEPLYGELANGRYKIIRRHQQVMRAPLPESRVQEILIVEFVINNNTPTSLGLWLW